MTAHYCARNQNMQANVTGNDALHTIGWDQCLSSDEISYDPNTKTFRLETSGIYTVSWSFYLGNLNENNTSAGYWIHGAANEHYPSQEPFVYTGNPWAARNPGGATGAGGDILSLTGSMSFYVNVEYDRWIRIAGRVAGNSTPNVHIVWDGYFSIVKAG